MISRFTYVSAALLLALAFTLPATAEDVGDIAPVKPKKEKRVRPEKPKLDADGNGSVSFEEFSAQHLQRLRVKFDAMDTDGDGGISEDERKAGHRPDKKGAAPKEGKKAKKKRGADAADDVPVQF